MARNHFGRRDDGTSEMSPETLDDWTAERLLRGALPPDDAPPGYGGVATLLAAARIEARTASSMRAEETIAAMAAAVRAHAVAVVPRRRTKVKVATAASAGLLAMSGMTAAGALPSAAQQHISTVLAKVGVSVPKGDGGHGQPRSGVHAPTTENNKGGTGTTTNHGDCVSAVAGSGGTQVSQVARTDCGMPSNAGGGPADDKTHPTQPPQSNGGSNVNGDQGNGQGHGNTPPTTPANASAPQAHEPSPPAKSSPPQNGHGQ